MTLGLRDTPKSYFDSLLEQRPWLVLSMRRLEFVSLIKISGELTIHVGLIHVLPILSISWDGATLCLKTSLSKKLNILRVLVCVRNLLIIIYLER